MQNRRRQNRQTFYILIALGVLITIGLCAGIVWYVNRQQSIAETVDLGEVATEPTATATFTAVPTITPSPTATSTPTLTPAPSPTTAPIPLTVSVSGPEKFPRGLPQAVEWQIQVEDGIGAVVVSIEDLNGVLLTGDNEGRLFLAKTIASEGTSSTAAAFSTEWTIQGILDPNVGTGSITFLFETTTKSERITLPWTVTNGSSVETQQYENPIDGIPIIIESESGTAEETLAPPPDGYLRYTSRANLQVIHPEGWFATEFQDGILQISAEPIVGDGSTPTETSYMSIIAGDRFAVGLPEDIQLNAEAITTWLLGDFTIVGGEEGGVFVSSELEVLDQYEITYDNGRNALVTELIPTTGISSGDFVAYIAVSASDDGIFILNGFIPDNRDDFLIFRTIIESIQFKSAP